MSYLRGHRAEATAALIATLAHAGQVDQGGAPYIDHPRRVAAHLVHPTWQAVTVAWLHDVVEDTTVTLAAIAETFGPQIAEAVDALTHRRGESRIEYYARVRANPLALQVKAADIADNLDPARLAVLDEATARRLQRKYDEAREHLGLVA